MKNFKKSAAQGDLLLIKINELPESIKEIDSVDGKHVVAHSETGHHHSVDATHARYFEGGGNEMVCYLSIASDTELFHDRPGDAHESITITKGYYEARRQRENSPMGDRRVAD